MGKYKVYTIKHVPAKYLEKLVKENPNDAELGKRIRQIILNNKS